jgi:hypothetical protein
MGPNVALHRLQQAYAFPKQGASYPFFHAARSGGPSDNDVGLVLRLFEANELVQPSRRQGFTWQTLGNEGLGIRTDYVKVELRDPLSRAKIAAAIAFGSLAEKQWGFRCIFQSGASKLEDPDLYLLIMRQLAEPKLNSVANRALSSFAVTLSPDLVQALFELSVSEQADGKWARGLLEHALKNPEVQVLNKIIDLATHNDAIHGGAFEALRGQLREHLTVLPPASFDHLLSRLGMTEREQAAIQAASDNPSRAESTYMFASRRHLEAARLLSVFVKKLALTQDQKMRIVDATLNERLGVPGIELDALTAKLRADLDTRDYIQKRVVAGLSDADPLLRARAVMTASAAKLQNDPDVRALLEGMAEGRAGATDFQRSLALLALMDAVSPPLHAKEAIIQVVPAAATHGKLDGIRFLDERWEPASTPNAESRYREGLVLRAMEALVAKPPVSLFGDLDAVLGFEPPR